MPPNNNRNASYVKLIGDKSKQFVDRAVQSSHLVEQQRASWQTDIEGGALFADIRNKKCMPRLQWMTV